MEIQTTIIDKHYLYYNCIYCGKQHSHGNERLTILGNWITYRTSHCNIKKEDIKLIINNYTIRKIF